MNKHNTKQGQNWMAVYALVNLGVSQGRFPFGDVNVSDLSWVCVKNLYGLGKYGFWAICLVNFGPAICFV